VERSLSNGAASYLLSGVTLGQGGYGKVYKCVRKSDYLPVAIKQVSKKRVRKDDNGQNIEVTFLKKLINVEGVIDFIDSFTTIKNEFIVTEYNEHYVDLFQYISEHIRIRERLAKYLFKQIVEIVITCIDLGIVHGDLKDENVLINRFTDKIKLIDFGSAMYYFESKKYYYTEFRGTQLFAPPEWILFERYGAEEITVWTLGCLLYTMLCGKYPFKDNDEIVAAVIEYPPEFHFREDDDFVHPNCLSTKVKNLIRHCLLPDDDERIPLKMVLKHSWLTSNRQDCIGLSESILNI
jgi:serine/threonine protein kinase